MARRTDRHGLCAWRYYHHAAVYACAMTVPTPLLHHFVHNAFKLSVPLLTDPARRYGFLSPPLQGLHYTDAHTVM